MKVPYRNKFTEKVFILKNKTYTNDAVKPDGLWYSIGDEWYNWTKKEQLNIKYKYVYEINIKTGYLTDIHNPDPNKLLQIKNVNDALIFNKKYNNYNWSKLKKHFAGIEIHNYNKIIEYIRNNKSKYWLFWVSLDVSCGCIWNIDVIKSCKLYKKLNFK